MEFLREFIKAGYIKAIGKMEDYKVILGASAYFDKGILKEEDLKEINEAINNQYKKVEEVIETAEEPIENIEQVENAEVAEED